MLQATVSRRSHTILQNVTERKTFPRKPKANMIQSFANRPTLRDIAEAMLEHEMTQATRATPCKRAGQHVCDMWVTNMSVPQSVAYKTHILNLCRQTD